MTVRRGEQWGSAAPLPADGVIVGSDAEARAVIERCRRAGRPIPPLGLTGGDLCRTLGGRGDVDRLSSPEATMVSCDLGAALLDGRLHWFVAHAVLRRSWWRGRVIAAMNAQWRGSWDVAPRAHPGDGLLDVLDSDLSPGDRWKARSRLPAGAHVPHPEVRVSRTAGTALELAPALDVWLDGERVGRASSVVLRVEPDVLTIVV